jgi:cell division protein FtsW (lipid II flippase)
MATRRGIYLLGTLLLLVIGAFLAYNAFGHVRLRIDNWVDPWSRIDLVGGGFQAVQGWFALGSGGVAGTGLGLGNPSLVPLATTDYIFAAIGEELGLAGSIAIVGAYLLLIGSMFRISIDAIRPFAKLFAAGLATLIGLQTFLIIGGVLRVIPLTGVTLPFVSYGGSSLVANFALLAILLRISDDTSRSRTSARVEP